MAKSSDLMGGVMQSGRLIDAKASHRAALKAQPHGVLSSCGNRPSGRRCAGQAIQAARQRAPPLAPSPLPRMIPFLRPANFDAPATAAG